MTADWNATEFFNAIGNAFSGIGSVANTAEQVSPSIGILLVYIFFIVIGIAVLWFAIKKITSAGRRF
jgi:hypothetical protein